MIQLNNKYHLNKSLTCIAYFSTEFMSPEVLPIYNGGLGNVPGNQLNATGDLDVPIMGIGLIFQEGSLRKAMDFDGEQNALYSFYDPSQMPITPLRQTVGEWLRLKINLFGHNIWLRVWQAQVGRLKLYILDTNDTANSPVYRGITNKSYDEGSELRFKQELILGIGWWHLLKELDIHPEVCHINEGHAAFAILELACSMMKGTG